MTSNPGLGARAMTMIDALAAISSEPNRLTRLYLSAEHRRAADLVAHWMVGAGLDTTIDGLGTVRGRYRPDGHAGDDLRVLLIGSHIDSVVDAGRFDGPLGVIAGLLAVEEIRTRGIALPFAVEVLAFGDEEGVRFPTTLVSSSALAGHFEPAVLERQDADGISILDALRSFHRAEPELANLACSSDAVLGYLEVHIEQGPVLEHEGLPVGIVTSLAGSNRFRCMATGLAGHAGTVPMELRRDALVATAELALEIERIARSHGEHAAVATIGEIDVAPGAVNVIPGQVVFSLDVRASEDEPRQRAVEEIRRAAETVGARRGVDFSFEQTHEVVTTRCAPRFDRAMSAAFEKLGLTVRRLPSGAGHDGQAMARLTDIGMIFVRCRDGVSHNPLEFTAEKDIETAIECVIATVEALAGDRDVVG